MNDDGAKERRSGGCLCGAVRYGIEGTVRKVIACHCSQCLRTHGHHAAYTAVPLDSIEIHGDDDVAWYQSSDIARRGFCRVCGSRLFWERLGADYVAVAAGTIDAPTGLTTSCHIYVADKSDYYEIADDLDQLPQGFGDKRPD